MSTKNKANPAKFDDVQIKAGALEQDGKKVTRRHEGGRPMRTDKNLGLTVRMKMRQALMRPSLGRAAVVKILGDYGAKCFSEVKSQDYRAMAEALDKAISSAPPSEWLPDFDDADDEPPTRDSDILDTVILSIFHSAGERGLTLDEAGVLVCEYVARSDDPELQRLADADPEILRLARSQGAEQKGNPMTDYVCPYCNLNLGSLTEPCGSVHASPSKWKLTPTQPQSVCRRADESAYRGVKYFDTLEAAEEWAEAAFGPNVEWKITGPRRIQ